ncbi:MAG: hypothetical protein CMO12_01850 [Thaumarchaeota archaeon]|nr:hypothetical protein [Nitrososphaerota archaeon]
MEDKKLIEKRYKLLESIKGALSTAALVSMIYAWYFDGFQLYSIYPLIVMAVFLPMIVLTSRLASRYYDLYISD